MSILFKIRGKPPNIYSFIYGSVLNPNCAVMMHLCDKVRAIIFVF
jgi:hypothetical protein